MESVIDQILKQLNLKNDEALLKELQKIGKVYQPQVSRWRTNGFAKSTEILISLLLNKIEAAKESKK